MNKALFALVGDYNPCGTRVSAIIAGNRRQSCRRSKPAPDKGWMAKKLNRRRSLISPLNSLNRCETRQGEITPVGDLNIYIRKIFFYLYINNLESPKTADKSAPDLPALFRNNGGTPAPDPLTCAPRQGTMSPAAVNPAAGCESPNQRRSSAHRPMHGAFSLPAHRRRVVAMRNPLNGGRRGEPQGSPVAFGPASHTRVVRHLSRESEVVDSSQPKESHHE